MDIPAKVTASAIVKSRSEAPDGFAIELEIASFNSQYPTKVTRIPEALASQLKVGQAVNLNLNRQALKKKADGTMKSGNYWSDYYWGIEGIAQNAPPVAAGTPQIQNQSTPVAYTPATEVNADKDTRIVREVCIEHAIAFFAGKDTIPSEVLGLAAQFEAWVTRKTPNQAPEVKEVPQQAPTQGTELFWPHFATIGDMMTFGTKQGVLMQEFASFLGVPKVADFKGTPDDAWAIIAQKKDLKPESIKR